MVVSSGLTVFLLSSLVLINDTAVSRKHIFFIDSKKLRSFCHRQELLDRRAARHLRKQQLAKRRTAASQVISSCDVI
jgi:hypothetical protein